MRKAGKPKLTLDRPAIYQTKVSGELNHTWSDWAGEMTIAVESDSEGLLVTTLTGTLDQAALQRLLRRLYSFGLPLISVIYIEQEDDHE